MSGGQNHKGIERLNIFLGAGCKDAPGKGVQMGIFCPVAFLEILCPSSRLLHGGCFPALLSTRLGVGDQWETLWRDGIYSSQAGVALRNGAALHKTHRQENDSEPSNRPFNSQCRQDGQWGSTRDVAASLGCAQLHPLSCAAPARAQPGWTSTHQQVPCASVSLLDKRMWGFGLTG